MLNVDMLRIEYAYREGAISPLAVDGTALCCVNTLRYTRKEAGGPATANDNMPITSDCTCPSRSCARQHVLQCRRATRSHCDPRKRRKSERNKEIDSHPHHTTTSNTATSTSTTQPAAQPSRRQTTTHTARTASTTHPPDPSARPPHISQREQNGTHAAYASQLRPATCKASNAGGAGEPAARDHREQRLAAVRMQALTAFGPAAAWWWGVTGCGCAARAVCRTG